MDFINVYIYFFLLVLSLWECGRAGLQKQHFASEGQPNAFAAVSGSGNWWKEVREWLQLAAATSPSSELRNVYNMEG